MLPEAAQHTNKARTHTPSPTSQLSIPSSPVWPHFLHVTATVSFFFFSLIHAPIALITNSPSHPRPRHCHHHHGTAQITPQMTTNDADCSSHDRYSTLVVLPVLLVLEWTESRPLRPTRLPEVPRNRKIQHCHHHHGTAQITPQVTTNGADCTSHDRYSIPAVLPMLLVLEWTESRPLRPTRLQEVPRNRKIQHCHHHHRTAQITPQMTTNGTDFSSHGRYSILAAPPRLSVLR